MKKLFKLRSLFILITALASISSAQMAETKKTSAQMKLPSANEVFGKFAEAVGGRGAAEKIKSRLVKGTAEIPLMSMKGTFENASKAPNKTLSSMNMTGYGEVVNGFDGSEAWIKDPAQGLRTKSAAELEQVKLSADFYNDINLDKTYPKAEVTGTDKIGTADVYIVKANANTTLFFDKQTGLLLRAERVAAASSAPHGEVKMPPVQISYEDYREVDGVKRPFTTRQTIHGGELIFKVSEIKQNVEIDDARFAKPK